MKKMLVVITMQLIETKLKLLKLICVSILKILFMHEIPVC